MVPDPVFSSKGCIDIRDSGEQFLCISMPGMVAYLIRRADLDDLAFVHDSDAAAHLPHYGKVMPDKQIGQSVFLLKPFEKFDDFRLNGDIQGRNRLVGNQHLRLQRQCPRDSDPLPLTAAEFVRISSRPAGIQPDIFKQGGNHPPPGGTRSAAAMYLKNLFNRPADRHPRVKRSERILKNHLREASEVFERRSFEAMNLDPLENHPAVRDRLKAENRPAKRALAATAFADQAERFACRQRQADTADGFKSSVADADALNCQ